MLQSLSVEAVSVWFREGGLGPSLRWDGIWSSHCKELFWWLAFYLDLSKYPQSFLERGVAFPLIVLCSVSISFQLVFVWFVLPSCCNVACT